MAQEINARVEISPDLQRLIDQNEELAPKAIKAGMKLIARQAPKKVRVKIRSLGLVKTGKFVKSIRGKTGKEKSIIGSRFFKGHILEGGANPHVIKPRRGNTKGGLWIPGFPRPIKRVVHPGVKAYKFLESTIDDMQNSGEIQSLFSQGVQAALEEMSQ